MEKTEKMERKEKKKKKKSFYLFHAGMIAVMVLIFFFSAQDGHESSEISNEFLIWILSLIGRFISSALSQWLTLWIRKIAHFTVYFVLGFLACGMFISLQEGEGEKGEEGRTGEGWGIAADYGRNRNATAACRKGWNTETACGKIKNAAMACGKGWMTATIYAASDEFHQLFVPGRAGMLKDVLLDSSGAAFGVLLICVFVLLRTYGKRQKQNKR